jgi:hypothetical protein
MAPWWISGVAAASISLVASAAKCTRCRRGCIAEFDVLAQEFMELQKVGALDPGAQAVVERTKLLGFGFKGKGATAGAGRGGRVREAELSHAV